MNKRIVALYVLFAVSGFCGLIYESIWSHYLKLFVGHAAYAQTLVLAVFMGGMGLGAWLTSRYTGRIGNLLWAYALVELITGVLALGFHPAFHAATDWAYASLLPASCSADGWCLTQWLLAALLILPQSVLLGSTFPLMSGGVLRLAPQAPGRALALLYFLNSAGAVAGVLASGFVLIPMVGLPGTLLTAGIGNIVLAVVVYLIGKGTGAAAPVAAAAPAADAAPPRDAAPALAGTAPLVRTLLVISALTGLSSFVYEVAWIRMLSMVFGSATHSFEIMLASFILGLALGGLWIRRRIDHIVHTLAFLARVQIAMGLLALLTLPLYAHLFDAMAWLMQALARNGAGYTLFTGALTVLSLAVMLPATFCAGMTLPLITVHLYRHGSGERAIGQVYAANTLGAIAGVLLTVHLLLPLLGLKLAMLVGAAIDIALGLWLLRPALRAGAVIGPGTRALAMAALALAIVVPFVAPFDPLRMSSGVFRDGRASFDALTTVLHAQDGKTASVHAVRYADGTVSLSTNGKSDGAIQMKPGEVATGDEITMTLLATLPLAYRPDATDVAVIGFGTGLSSATLLASPQLERVDTIEIEPAMVEAARHFRPMNDRAFTDPRHHIVLDDAKSYFSRGQRRYDAIISEPSNPWVSGVSSLFTEEFYARARLHLKEGGLLVQWMHVYEITPELVASIFTALSTAFPVYDVYMGSSGDMVIVATQKGPLQRRTDALFANPALKAQLERVGLGSDNRIALQFLSNQRALAPLVASYAMPANSDFFPTVDLKGPEARFQRASATSWTLMHTQEVPVLRALDGAPRLGIEGELPGARTVGSRQVPYARARQAMDLVRDGVVPPADRNYLPEPESKLIVRQRLFGCDTARDSTRDTTRDSKTASLDAPPIDALVRFASETLPYLGDAENTAFWRAARSSPCRQALGTVAGRWLELFEAVASQRWPEAGQVAAAALADPATTSPLQRTVLTKVLVTALILNGQRGDALQVMDAELPRLPASERDKLWPRWLRARAGAESVSARQPG